MPFGELDIRNGPALLLICGACAHRRWAASENCCGRRSRGL